MYVKEAGFLVCGLFSDEERSFSVPIARLGCNICNIHFEEQL